MFASRIHPLFLNRGYATRPPSIRQIIASPNFGDCKVLGWVRSARKQKQTSFLDIGDGSCSQSLQVVASPSQLPAQLNFHSCVAIDGELRPSSHPKQEVELVAREVHLLRACHPAYPFQPRQAASQEHVRGHPTCKAKTNSVQTVMRMRGRLSRSIHQFFQDKDYLEIHTPLLTTNDCEGGGDVFTVSAPKKDGEESYWDQPVFLTVSGQLHLEAICNGIARVYTFNPAFRAERGRTRRHLSEFWMVEAEVAFLDDIDELVSEMEGLVKNAATDILENCSQEVMLYNKAAGIGGGISRLEAATTGPWHTIEYRDAAAMVSDPKHKLPPLKNGDLGREHELWLCKHIGGVVAVVNWPAGIKPAYMREVEGSQGGLVSICSLLNFVCLLFVCSFIIIMKYAHEKSVFRPIFIRGSPPIQTACCQKEIKRKGGFRLFNLETFCPPAFQINFPVSVASGNLPPHLTPIRKWKVIMCITLSLCFLFG